MNQERRGGVTQLYGTSRHGDGAEADAPVIRRLRLSPALLGRGLVVAIAGILGLSAFVRLAHHFNADLPLMDAAAEIFYVDYEQSIATLFSVLLLLACAAVLAAVAAASSDRRHRDVRYWVALSVLFVGLAADEFLMLHERAIEPVRGWLGTSGVLYVAWVIPGAAAVLLLAGVFAGFVLRLPRAVRLGTVASGVAFVSGAIGMEMLGSPYYEADAVSELRYLPIVHLEEALEMSGAALFLYTVFHHLVANLGGFELRLATGGQPTSAPVSAAALAETHGGSGRSRPQH